MRILLCIVTLIALTLFVLYLRSDRNYELVLVRVNDSQQKIMELQDENRKLEQINSSLKDRVESVRQPATFSSTDEAGDSRSEVTSTAGSAQDEQSSAEIQEDKAPKKTMAQMKARLNKWRVAYKVANIEQRMSLSEEQKQRLAEKFQKEIELRQKARDNAGDGNSNSVEVGEDATESFADILGAESAAKYEQEILERKEKAKKDALDQWLYAFTRKLGLSPDQEPQLRQILVETAEETAKVDAEIDKQMRAMVLGSGDTAAEDETISVETYKEAQAKIKELHDKRRAVVNPKFREILNDEQYNRLLEEQANQVDTFIKFLD